MKFSKPERWLTPHVRTYLRSQGFTRSTTELPFFDRRIDVYAYSRKHDRTVAVELKLEKWRGALRQALIYQLCAEFVFVAMPLDAIASVELQQLRAHGVGLLSVSSRGSCSEILPALPSAVLSGRFRRTYSSLLNRTKE